MNPLRLLPLLLLLVTGTLFAANVQLPPASFRLIALNAQPGLLFDQPKGPPLPVPVSPSHFSAPRPAPLSGRLEFFREEPPATPGAPSRRVAVATARVSTEPGAETLIVLFFPNRAAQPDWPVGVPKVLTLDATVAAHPAGDVRVVNLGTRPLGLKLGSETGRLAYADSMVVHLSAEPKPWLQAAVLGPAGWERVVGVPLRIVSGNRLTLFFLDPMPVEGDPFPVGSLLCKVADRPTPPDAG
jgi:hypothetical protein